MKNQLLDELKQEYQHLLDQNRLSEALPLIRQAAHWADVDSQILAERIYLHELYDHPVQKRAGIEYARLAAMNGDLISMSDLGMMYADDSLPDFKDFAKALYWLEKAALAGEKNALDALGMMYLQGRGVPRDLHEAARCFRQAKEAGADQAERHLHMAKLYAAKEQAVPKENSDSEKKDL